MKIFSKYFFTLFVILLVGANIYALPNIEKKKELSGELFNQITPSPAYNTIDIESITNLKSPETLEEKFSYAYSYLLYLSSINEYIKINPEYYAKGAIDAAEGNSLFTDKEISKIFEEMQQQMLYVAQQQQEEEELNNLLRAEEFLKENLKNENVFETDSGLQYKVVRIGSGDYPTINDQVVVNYEIYNQDEVLLMKKESDSNFYLDLLVPEFVEGITLMNMGSKYRFFVHPKLTSSMEETYNLPPNSLLIFDVELVEIIKDANS